LFPNGPADANITPSSLAFVNGSISGSDYPGYRGLALLNERSKQDVHVQLQKNAV